MKKNNAYLVEYLDEQEETKKAILTFEQQEYAYNGKNKATILCLDSDLKVIEGKTYERALCELCIISYSD